MEQHPVPQNVTTFQFRLIGDMTIKQFGYLAAGAILAYISFKLPLPFFLNWVLAGVFGLGGFGFAFVPVEERPMDVWFFSFLKSIYSPTQFLWQKSPPAPVVSPPLPTGPTIQPAPPTKLEPEVSLPKPVAAASSPPAVTLPQTTPSGPTDFAASLEEKIKTLSAERAVSEANEERFVTLQKQLQDVLADRQRLEQELNNIKRRLSAYPPSGYPATPFPGRIPSLSPRMPPPASPYSAEPTSAPAPSVSQYPASPPPPMAMPQVVPPVTAGAAPSARLVSPATAQSVGAPKLTTFANVVSGMVKDHEGNLLPGILITVRNPDGVPLRALKTNQLGQFAASTPLPNGNFVIEAEDPRTRFTFEKASFTLKGEILPPVEIIAKSQKEVERSKLAQQVFGKLD